VEVEWGHVTGVKHETKDAGNCLRTVAHGSSGIVGQELDQEFEQLLAFGNGPTKSEEASACVIAEMTSVVVHEPAECGADIINVLQDLVEWEVDACVPNLGEMADQSSAKVDRGVLMAAALGAGPWHGMEAFGAPTSSTATAVELSRTRRPLPFRMSQEIGDVSRPQMKQARNRGKKRW
jgi:hypothetical protein